MSDHADAVRDERERQILAAARESMTDSYAEVIRTVQQRGVVEGIVDAADMVPCRVVGSITPAACAN